MSNLKLLAIDLTTKRQHFVDPSGQGGGESDRRRELLTVLQSGQTSFQLQAIAQRPDLSELSLNGAKAFYGTDYVLNGVILTWLSLIQLASDDQLEIIYLF